MALSYKARRRWALIILLVGLPLYIICAVAGVALVYAIFERPPVWIEFVIYVALGILWALPFKSIFLGVGQADSDADPEDS
jgi:uncharacterized membrane protein